jgi:DNA polymerase-1|tara:strand:+ start:941 stop:2575 length:1635 start_codon:yes stop_codon:yes gene_type:complete
MLSYIVDIETDSLQANRIHCIVARNYNSNVTRTWIGEECGKFGKWSKRIDQFIMHNGISFDAPILNRLAGTNIKLSQVRDTLIESQLYNPMREEGHSLKAWGKKLNFEKGELDDFKEYNQDMLEYCIRDTELNRKLAVKLEEEGKTFSKKSYELERQVRAIIDQQQKNGFAFNLKEALSLQIQLEEEQYELEQKAEEIFPPKIVTLKTKTKEIPFNIASRKQIAERLEEKGWKPKLRTEKGNVIINEEVLSKIKMDEAQMFNRYFLLQKRTGLIKAWIKACEKDDRVRGEVLTLRTITGRMAHHSPNMAQVPASYSPYGKECRNLWTVSNPDTHSLVGTDASGLELRCLAHYMDDKAYTKEVLTGDVHTANQTMAGLKTRDQAKTFIYAFLYGAGPAKIGKVVGQGVTVGKLLTEQFLKQLPALKRLRSNTFKAAKKGTIKGLDGRRLQIRHSHAALNTLIQGAGAIVCKQWLVEMTTKVRRLGLDAKLVASVHDEYQFEVANTDVEKFCLVTKEAMQITTKVLDMKCDLDCDYKVGKTWAETH